MKSKILGFCFLLFSPAILLAQWPKEIKAKNGAVISIYQPQPELLQGNKLSGRAAFSAKEKPSDELQFGMFWYEAILNTNRDTRKVSLERIVISGVKLPGITDTSKINKLVRLLESEIPKWEFNTTIDDISATLKESNHVESTDLKNEAPLIYYKNQYTTLVLIDGEPKLEDDKDLQIKKVVNTAFLIVENPDDKKYYLYGGQFWYESTSIKEGYVALVKLPARIATLDAQIKKQKSSNYKIEKESIVPAIFISTKPAELIQSNGPADYVNVAGTNLLYVKNSEDNIFKNISDQNYYLLLSGRWYSSSSLEGPWVFIASNMLPDDFKKIPEGSDKDNVLPSVAGTPASKEAVMDAQVPQTAKVDRKTATCTVTYNGEPVFEKIEGTTLELAMNTSSTVMRSAGKYYCVDNGVWFVSAQAKGPWSVSDVRPNDVDKIPASSPAYNVQYVYIYEATPTVVYVGYTPGYTGCYVYGNVVVYGTGYYYNPWYGPYYYPRPVTYGYSMHYNPYMGWSVSIHYSSGCYHGGYWGPPMYRPPYHAPHHGGYYGSHGPTYVHNGDININTGNSNNIYNKQKGISTNDVNRGEKVQKPQSNNRNNAATNNINKPSNGNGNNVYTDKQGNVYQQKSDGNWQKRDGNQWGDAGQNTDMNAERQNRDRSAQQNSNSGQNREQGATNFGGGGGNMRGGGMRGGGGGRGGRR